MRERIIVLPKGLGRVCDDYLATALERGELRPCGQCSDSVIEAYHTPKKQRHQHPIITRAYLWLSHGYWLIYWRLDYALWYIKREARIIMSHLS